MLNRIDLLKENLFNNPREISLERALLYTQSHQQTEGEPVIIRRAKATAHILDHVEISIRDNERIAGNRTVKPRSGIASPEMDPDWILKEIDTIETRPQDAFVFGEKDKEIYRKQLYPYWEKRAMKVFIKGQIKDDIKAAEKAKIFSINQTDKGQGHIIIDYPLLLENGLEKFKNHVKNYQQNAPDNMFFKAVLIILEGAQRHIERYICLAEKMRDESSDETRKIELEQLIKTSRKIKTEPPQSLYEAVQLFWYMNVILQYESNASSISLGRFDQYMYPYYKHDISQGVAEEELEELLAELWVKTNDVVLLRSEASAKFFAGFPTGYTALLGGLNIEGRSAINPLSYLCLSAYQKVLLPQPNLGVRINELVDRRFMLKTVETIRLGTGIPQIFNDEVIIPAFLNRGVSLEDARDYAVVGCVELSIAGRTYGLHDIAMFNFVKILEIVLHSYRGQSELIFDDIVNTIKDKIKYYIELMVKGSNICDLGHREYAPTPLLSSFVCDSLKKGEDITAGGARYNFSGVQGIGTANLSDSLMAIYRFIFQEKKMKFDELLDILESNWQGEKGEDIRKYLMAHYSAYGNDMDEVDDYGADILRFYCKALEPYKNARDGSFIPGSYTVSAHVPLGEVCGATPDGRFAGEQLADGGLSPMLGRDIQGPTAVLKSVSKLDNYLLANGSLLNLKFIPKSLEGNQGLHKLSDFLMAFMKLKIQHIQFNIVDAETLRKVQKNPSQYASLVVRVAGYSAFFVDLSQEIQDDIIRRTSHELL